MQLLLTLLLLAPALLAQDDPVFGTTVVISGGLRGDIYNIPPGTNWLPDFRRLTPVGSIYTTELNVGTRNFRKGFPGVTDRFEWFAIDYTGRFWIETPGKYEFALVSDDGSKLYIDGHTIIDNDGTHSTQGFVGKSKLKQGWHQLRVSYYQGPGDAVALMLAIQPPGERDPLIFNTDDYLPPGALAEITKDKPQLTPGSPEWRKKREPSQRLEFAR